MRHWSYPFTCRWEEIEVEGHSWLMEQQEQRHGVGMGSVEHVWETAKNLEWLRQKRQGLKGLDCQTQESRLDPMLPAPLALIGVLALHTPGSASFLSLACPKPSMP